TGTYAIGTAITGYLDPAGAGVTTGARLAYVVVDSLTAPTAFEIGEGIYTAGSPGTLTRAQIRRNTTGGTSAVNWGAGTKYLMLAPSAANLPTLDTDGLLTAPGLALSGAATIGGALAVTGNASITGNTTHTGTTTMVGAATMQGGATLTGGGFAVTPVAVAASTIDLSQGNYFYKSATGALSWTFSNAPASRALGFVLELTNGGLGAQTWPAAVKWPSGLAPTLTSSGVDVLVFLTRDGGTTWRGVLSQRDSR
ncbi:MAG: hypothetical protein EBR82_32005, partial [Caulobacteraceae bacterium]|nr:hypothetical protein [Caulobacteraceae bacterium]